MHGERRINRFVSYQREPAHSLRKSELNEALENAMIGNMKDTRSRDKRGGCGGNIKTGKKVSMGIFGCATGSMEREMWEYTNEIRAWKRAVLYDHLWHECKPQFPKPFVTAPSYSPDPAWYGVTVADWIERMVHPTKHTMRWRDQLPGLEIKWKKTGWW